MSFDTLGLTPDLLRAVSDQGYSEPTPVQSEAIPLVLARRDVLAGAQTGTGKTAAFVLPILQLLAATEPPMPNRSGRGPARVLVLAPTRELAMQVEESVRVYGANGRIRSAAVFGGVSMERQVRALRSGPEIVVATPGRLLDHVGQRTVDLSAVEILVLDEADRMLDMGFIRDIRRILSLLPAKRQNLFFSATFSEEIRRLADGILERPATVQVSPRNTAPELVRQRVLRVDRDRKRELLSHLVRSRQINQALVFTRTKHGANRLAQQLDRDGIAVAAIHGNKSQPQRVRALADFKAGRINILVATDIAARGIDIDALPHVVNYELPMVPDDYVHRIGRTGRAGVDGEAISLVCVDEASLLRAIEDALRMRIPSEAVPGYEPDGRIRPEAIQLRSFEPRPFEPRPFESRPSGQRPSSQRPSSQHPAGPRPAAHVAGQAGHRAGGPAAGRGRPARPAANSAVEFGNRPVRGDESPRRDMPSAHPPRQWGGRQQTPAQRPSRSGPGPADRPPGRPFTALPGERLSGSGVRRQPETR